MPLTLPIGSVTGRIRSSSPTPSASAACCGRSAIARSPRPEWAMWQLDYIRRAGGERVRVPASNLFFLPPSMGTVLEGGALEEVLFMRDEMANLAWAIERSVEGPLEAAVPRGDGVAEAAPESAPGEIPSQGPRLSACVACPRQLGAAASRAGEGRSGPDRVEAGAGRGAAAGRFGQDPSRHGRDPERGRRAGPVRRGGAARRHTGRPSRRLARWIDGTTILWTGYRKHVGRGEGSSRLRFDRLIDPSGPA